MAEVGTILLELGEISGENIFIDGTKIESVANKYTFVWKRTVSKNMQKITERICAFCAECEELYALWHVLCAVYERRARVAQGIRKFESCHLDQKS